MIKLYRRRIFLDARRCYAKAAILRNNMTLWKGIETEKISKRRYGHFARCLSPLEREHSNGR